MFGLSTLLATACGDDFSQTNTTTPDDDVTSEHTSGSTTVTPKPTGTPQTPPAPSSASSEPPTNPTPPDAVSDASPEGPTPPDGPGPKPTDCGGADQPCCEDAQCRPGFECVAADPDAGSPFTCERDENKPAPPTGDAGPPAPPPRDRDGGMPGPKPPPPKPEQDGGAPPPPPKPDEDCGAEGERCCKGPGGRCDDGLTCDNPNGPELDDSVCVK